MNTDDDYDPGLAAWYCTLSDVPHEEVRRMVCLYIALTANATPPQVVPLARLIELFLTGHGDGVESFITKQKAN